MVAEQFQDNGRGSPAPSKGGRPHALTPEVQEHILRLVGQGNFVETAVAASGITKQCLYNWRKRLAKGDPVAERYREFFDALKTALALGEVAALRQVLAGGAGWQRWAWFLERRHPHHWARKDMIIIKGVRDLGELSDEELEDLERRLRGRRLA